MIKIIIIEDEIPARKKLKRFLEGLYVQTEIIAEIDNVTSSIEILRNEHVDLIFSDIELLDGNAFDIYKQVFISCPIIFTTAYDKFWMNAFESNGIAYLLKPFSRERFQNAWDKFMLFRNISSNQNEQISNLTKLIELNYSNKNYKKRFSVNTNKGFFFIDIEIIAFFEINEGVIFARDISGKKYMINELSLKELEEQLNPSSFFRINRSEIVSKENLERIERYSKNILALKMKGCINHLKTSQSNTAAFREWIVK